ncbi:MAG TPA: 50S ribosomal protein L17 [Candidatus Andersenbacteria bacterium]|nr:50S ribosomal protein L17 [Candidatus Andersenbacteria bacterium]
MRKKVNNRILGRSTDERLHLMRLLTSSLLEHGAITTSEAKAKELRRHFEPLVTRAKQELTLANRRLLISELAHKTELPLLLEVAKKNEKRPGGYLRITKLPVKRSDAAHMAHIEIL